MAQHNNYGALGSLTRDEFESLSLGVQGLNNPLNIMGKSIPRNDVLMQGLGMVSGLGTPMAIGSIIGQYKAQSAANKLLNREADFFDTLKGINTGVTDVRNKSGVDLAPMYSGGNEANMVQGYGGKTMPSGATANPYSSGRFSEQMDSIKGSALEGTVAQSAINQNSKSVSDYAGDAINQTNITNYDPSKGTYDKNFADAVTRESQGDSAGAGSTFICTALYEMGDMKKSIYKYDSMYGKKVNSAIYRGYALWGEPLAKQIKKKGMMYKLIKPIALTWANQMAYDLSKGKIGKNSLAMKITKTIGEGCCYILGQIFKRRTLWLKST